MNVAELHLELQTKVKPNGDYWFGHGLSDCIEVKDGIVIFNLVARLASTMLNRMYEVPISGHNRRFCFHDQDGTHYADGTEIVKVWNGSQLVLWEPPHWSMEYTEIVGRTFVHQIVYNDQGEYSIRQQIFVETSDEYSNVKVAPVWDHVSGHLAQTLDTKVGTYEETLAACGENLQYTMREHLNHQLDVIHDDFYVDLI